MFLIESLINTNLNQGRHFAKDIEGTNTGEYAGVDGYIINPVYLQNNNAEKKFFTKPLNAEISEEFPHSKWYFSRRLMEKLQRVGRYS